MPVPGSDHSSVPDDNSDPYEPQVPKPTPKSDDTYKSLAPRGGIDIPKGAPLIYNSHVDPADTPALFRVTAAPSDDRKPITGRPVEESVTEELRNIAGKYDQIHKEMADAGGVWTPRPEADRVLSGAARDVRVVDDRLNSLAAEVGRADLPRTIQAVADLQHQVSDLKDEVRELRGTVTASVPVRATALDHVAGSLARITICTLIGTLIAGPILTALSTMPFSPWVAKMIDVSFSSFFASAAAEVGLAATRGIDG